MTVNLAVVDTPAIIIEGRMLTEACAVLVEGDRMGSESGECQVGDPGDTPPLYALLPGAQYRGRCVVQW